MKQHETDSHNSSKQGSGRHHIAFLEKHLQPCPGHQRAGRRKTRIENLSDCDDTRVMVRALSEMPDTIDIGAAGTAMRFLTAYLSVNEGTRTLTGTERMLQRPIGILAEALRTMGADVEYIGREGYPPLRITGHTLTNGEISLPGNVSSQYISALLMIGPALKTV